MNIRKSLSLLLLSLLFYCVSSVADQAQRVSKKEATLALQLLQNEHIQVLKKYCESCGNTTPENLVIETSKIQDAHYKGLWEVVVNGQAIDLAYYYLPINGRWKNLARTVDIYLDDVPKYLDQISLQEKVENDRGWYINEKQNVILTKEVNTRPIIALLGRGSYQKLSIFFQTKQAQGCADGQSEQPESTPMYVNQELVRFAVICKGELVVFYADTEPSNDFVLAQFLAQPSVTLKAYSGGEDLIFSTKNFNELYEKATGKTN
ncbi:hypothetical protein [Psychromonas sp. B3M02]|uniref:hypothetical protein n=1 Tax=Psychromonas sp. B3M02 TaxID=2267226 RepID=UPI0011BFC877|nr:hypothetical protein [Psychromonas sp. B3M02]